MLEKLDSFMFDNIPGNVNTDQEPKFGIVF